MQFKDSQLLAEKIRLHVLEMTHKGNSSHVGSCLSIADILSVLYCKIMVFDKNYPESKIRDRFILSKGHAGAALYSCLAEQGFFNIEELKIHYQNGSKFSGHVSHYYIPGVEFSTGSLGHGLSIGVGMALAAKKRKQTHNVFVLISDGELDEGSNWEAILFAAHHKLDNLTVLLDYNNLQSIDSVKNTLNIEPLEEKIKAFNWNYYKSNGHDHEDLYNSFLHKPLKDKPSFIACHTTKGFGISFMENSVLWHYRSPQKEEYSKAKNELKIRLHKIKNA